MTAAPTHAALLRAVNLGPHGKTPMAELKALFHRLGYGDAKTLLASGNVVFTPDAPAEDLEPRLEAEIEAAFGHRPDVLVRSGAEIAAAAAQAPFPESRAERPNLMHAFFLRAEPEPEAVAALEAAVAEWPERVAVRGRVCWLDYPTGSGTSKLSNTVVERKLGVRGTARNWNTVGKLIALTGG